MTIPVIDPGPDVTVNGIVYPTELVDDVQRFRTNSVVALILKKHDSILHELSTAVDSGEFALSDWIAFNTMYGYSIDGFCDLVESMIQMNEDLFPGALEDYFTIVNPLWQD